MFQLYSCKVRLAGNMLSEVPKTITAPEYHVLKVIHGPVGGEDPVLEIKATAEFSDNDDAKERTRLSELYGPALHRHEDFKSVNAIFGPIAPLPKAIPGAGVVDIPADELAELGA